MGTAYPELAEAAPRVEQVLKQEEERFGETLEHGMKILEAAIAKDSNNLDAEAASRVEHVLKQEDERFGETLEHGRGGRGAAGAGGAGERGGGAAGARDD